MQCAFTSLTVKQQTVIKSVKTLKFIGELSPESLSLLQQNNVNDADVSVDEPPILVVPNVKAPPRVPKLVTAIAYNLTIVDFSWVTAGKGLKSEIDMYKMEYRHCDSLFESYKFSMP